MSAARMSRPTRKFLAGNTVSMAGNGLVIAFMLIYLHQVRGLALPVVGALLAASAAAGLIVVTMIAVLTPNRPLSSACSRSTSRCRTAVA